MQLQMLTFISPPGAHNASATAEIFLIKRTKDIIKSVETLKWCHNKCNS